MDARGVRQLLVQGLAVADAAAEELGPLGDGGQGVGLLGEEAPELRVVPGEVVQALRQAQDERVSRCSWGKTRLLANGRLTSDEVSFSVPVGP